MLVGENDSACYDGHDLVKGAAMKKQGIGYVIAVLVLLLAMSGVAQAEVYVEGFIGGNAAADMGGAKFHQRELPPTPPEVTPPPQPPTPPPDNTTPDSFLNMNSSGAVSPACVIGARVGTWFVPNGALGLQYPAWMKYFGVYTDVSYNQLKVSPQSVQASDRNDGGVFQGSFTGEFYSSGYVVTWAFMAAARYGFLPNDKVPFGRLQPWVGIGPAILFTGMRPKANVFNSDGTLGAQASPGWRSTVAPALVVDAGVRYMLRPNISVDLSFRYRYAQPNFNFNFTDINGGASKLKFSPVYNLFSGMLGVAYHF